MSRSMIVFLLIIDFSVALPCKANATGVVIIDAYFNFSTILNGILINNTFSFFFHRSCIGTLYIKMSHSNFFTRISNG